MSKATARLLQLSAFATLQEAEDFVKWYEEPGQWHTGWDTTRYNQAQSIFYNIQLEKRLETINQLLINMRMIF